MSNYIIAPNGELYHYGVKGMKWGVRRAAKQLAKRTGRSVDDIGEAEAKRFKRDVKRTRRGKGIHAEVEEYENGKYLRVKKWMDSDGRKVGERYAQAVMDQASRNEMRNATIGMVAGTAVALAGQAFLRKMIRG